jgi:peptide/nickel transport system substrate-binding protein
MASTSRATFSQPSRGRTLFAGGAQSGLTALASYHSSSIPSAENRWTGRNFGGWSNPEYDRLHDTFVQTLDRSQRIAQMAQLNRIIGEQLPVIPMYFSVDGVAHVAALRGPQMVAPEAAQTWNVHQWELD